MRVIAGEFRSRKLKSVEGMDVRPTPDRMRETLFNVIAAEMAGSVFLDAYAGTGAVGIEALSRGAASGRSLSRRARSRWKSIKSNLASLGPGGARAGGWGFGEDLSALAGCGHRVLRSAI